MKKECLHYCLCEGELSYTPFHCLHASSFEDIKIPFNTWVSAQGEVMHISRGGFVDCGKASQNLTSEKGQICKC